MTWNLPPGETRPIEIDNTYPIWPNTHFENRDSLWSWLETGFTNYFQIVTGHDRRWYSPQRLRSTYNRSLERNIFAGPVPNDSALVLTKISSNEYTGFMIVQKLREREDGTWTQLPEIAIEALGEPIDLDMIGEGRWTFDDYGTWGQGRGSALADGQQILNSTIKTDKIGSISIFGDSEYAEEVSAKLEEVIGTSRQKVFRLKSFFKGSGEVEFSTENQTVKQICSGQRIFLYKSRVWTINTETQLWEQREVISLGMMDSTAKLRKYVKARQWLASFASSLNSNGLKFFNPNAYRAWIKEVGQGLTKYWGGTIEVLDLENLDADEIHKRDSIDEAEQNAKVGDKEFHVLNVRANMLSTQAGQRLARARNAVAQIKDKVALHEATLEDNRRRTRDRQREIADYARRIEEYKSYMQTAENHLSELEQQKETSTSQLNLLMPTLPTLEATLQAELGRYEVALEEEVESSQSNASSFTSKLKKTGILVKDILYHSDGGFVSAAERPDLLTSSEAKLAKIEFVTTRPLTIYVDRHDNPNTTRKVMGGPYEVVVSFGTNANVSMTIRLASHDALFGYEKHSTYFNARVHPHTPTFTLYRTADSFNQFIERWVSPCLGDAAPSIARAAVNNDPKIGIMGALAWITSAYSRDSWGVTWRWFPKPEEVDPDGKFDSMDEEELTADDVVSALQEHLGAVGGEEIPELTEEDIRTAVEEIQAAVANGTYSPYGQIQ